MSGFVVLWRLSLRGEAGLFAFALLPFEAAAKRLEILFMRDAPPLYTIVGQLVGWTLDRTADFPKSQRFTFGQRLDNLSLDCLQQVVRAIYSPGKQRSSHLSELNLKLEELRVCGALSSSGAGSASDSCCTLAPCSMSWAVWQAGG
jgi:hypothetical protein